MRLKQSKQTEPEDKVKLKPFMGIRPGVYLTVIYSIILLIVFFFVLINHGLKNPGALLSIKTEPDGAAIRVDDIYMGTSKDRIFVSEGRHTIEVVLPGFPAQSAVHEIPGRVFGSVFFPIRYPIEVTLKASDPAAAFAYSAADFAAWTFGGEPSVGPPTWQIPLSLSEGAYRIGPENDTAAKEILQAAARFTVTRAALRDLVRAKMFLDNGGLSPSPGGAVNSISGILVFLSENPGSAAWLSGLLPPESAAVVKASGWFKNEALASVQAAAPVTDISARRFELSGINFISIPGKKTMIGESPVSRTLYNMFLNENPAWKEEDQNDLYPEEISIHISEVYGMDAVTGISWYAAESFCRWLTKRLPSSMADMEVRLPAETEWEYVPLKANKADTGWEWCADPFVQLPFFKAPPKAIKAVGSPERSLKGRMPSITSETRASLPPDFTSPFVTFRPVIAEKANEK